MPHEIIETAQAPKAIGPYSQAVRAGETTWLSGQIALNPATGELEGPGDIEAQTHQVMKNLLAVLEAAGHRPTDLVRTTIYLVNLEDFAVVNSIYGAALGGHRPARATVQVARLPKDSLVEIDGVAVGG